MRGNWIGWSKAGLVAAGLALAVVGGRGNDPFSKAMLMAGILSILAVLLVFWARIVAAGIAEKTREVERSVLDSFPRLRRWAWPLALLAVLAMLTGEVVYSGWQHERKQAAEQAPLGDFKWSQNLAIRNAKQP
jgi:hypothetical protein